MRDFELQPSDHRVTRILLILWPPNITTTFKVQETQNFQNYAEPSRPCLFIKSLSPDCVLWWQRRAHPETPLHRRDILTKNPDRGAENSLIVHELLQLFDGTSEWWHVRQDRCWGLHTDANLQQPKYSAQPRRLH